METPPKCGCLSVPTKFTHTLFQYIADLQPDLPSLHSPFTTGSSTVTDPTSISFTVILSFCDPLHLQRRDQQSKPEQQGSQ